jgi:hypothetical protein
MIAANAILDVIAALPLPEPYNTILKAVDY